MAHVSWAVVVCWLAVDVRAEQRLTRVQSLQGIVLLSDSKAGEPEKIYAPKAPKIGMLRVPLRAVCVSSVRPDCACWRVCLTTPGVPGVSDDEPAPPEPFECTR
jgi:hypothetical protein